MALGRKDSEAGALCQGNIEQKRRETRVCRVPIVCQARSPGNSVLELVWLVSRPDCDLQAGWPQGSDFAFLHPSSVRGILTPTLQNCREGERGNDERHPEQVLACK